MKKNLVKILIIIYLDVFSGSSWTAHERITNDKSIHTLRVSADYAGTALINNLSDMVFTSVNPVVALAKQENVCVFANSLLGGTYSVTATGSGVGNAFTVSNGAATVAYTVRWAPITNATTGTALTTGVPLPGQNTGILSSLCLLGITNSTLFVNFSLPALQNAASGVFTGVLTLVITPV